jgi:hypothetical protein
MSSSFLRLRLARAVVGACTIVVVLGTHSPVTRAQQTVPPLPKAVTYILPLHGGLIAMTDLQYAAAVADLRARLAPTGEGALVRLGFSAYIFVSMDDWNVDVNDPAAIRARLSQPTTTFPGAGLSTIDQIDIAVGRAVRANVPICLSFLTALRAYTDPAQTASQAEDRRNMQWYKDNALATGWWTHSQYARKQRKLQEAYIRELGKIVAGYMARYPEIVVAATGDGEVELTSLRWWDISQTDPPSWADYSPFAIAEFRDWLRGVGLYADGQPLAGQGYSQRARYATDTTPADAGADGHSLNGDFGTAFSSWELRYFDWSLSDDTVNDPHAIPQSQYGQQTWNAMPDRGAGYFDAPRPSLPQPGSAWWNAWNEFRQRMIQHHNRDFAKWMTTSPDPVTGATIPVERWYSDQIPADTLFGSPPPDQGVRLVTSASPWWTADVSPYGCPGISAYNVNLQDGTYARTLVNVAPLLAERSPSCWALTEWNPSDPWTADPTVYRQEMEVVERYRPRLMIPYIWDNTGQWRVPDTGFEVALREMVARIKNPQLSVDHPSLRVGVVRNSSGGGAQQVMLSQIGSGQVTWTASSDRTWLQVTPSTGTGAGLLSVSVNPMDAGLQSVGTATGRITISSPNASNTATIDVNVTVTGGPTAAPFGQVDTPLQNASGLVGAIGVTGWALDDIGVSSVRIFRNCLPFDNQAGCQAIAGQNVVYIGDAAFLAGARPDVESAFSPYPNAYRAGWGYLMLTNMLPHVPRGEGFGGQGPLTLYAFATDFEGNVTLLGRSSLDHVPTAVNLANDTIAKPFGAIDTPGQGQVVGISSGGGGRMLANFGWALTPDSDTAADPSDILIPTDGSTMNVFIDGVAVSPVHYNQCRGSVGNPVPSTAYCDDDVANIFGNPAPRPVFTRRESNPTRYRNLDQGRSVIGSYDIDLATLANGMHTIAWGVTDSAGRPEGIGSRFFIVLNAAAGDAGTAASGRRAADAVASYLDAPAVSRGNAAPVEALSPAASPVPARMGYDTDAAQTVLAAGDDGVFRVQLDELGRLELRLGSVESGFLVANGTLRDLPLGSHLDAARGVFTWTPPAGYIGTYRLAFVRDSERYLVDVRIRPAERAATGESEVRMFVDSPRAGDSVANGPTVEGWALDPAAALGSGIDAVHVWARRADVAGSAPVFLGAATLGVSRPDVAAAFGPQFNRAGYRLTAASLGTGRYEITVYVRNRRTDRWEDARSVLVTAR